MEKGDKTMKKVYVVVYHNGPVCSEGCWDTCVKDVFFTEEDAEKWIVEQGPQDGYYDIEERQIH